MRVPFAGGGPEPVSLPAFAREGLRVESVRFFGRGRGMAVRVFDESAQARRTYLLKADGTDPVLLPSSVPVGAVSPDGRRLIASSGYSIRPLYRAPAYPKRGEKVAFDKALDSPRSVDAVRFAPDGAHVVVSDSRSGRQVLYRWDAAFRQSTVLFDKPSQVTGSPTYSPDGQWVAFDARVGSPAPDIWIVPAGGGEARRLTDGPAEDNTPCFDATGDWVYFTSDREGDQQLYRVARTGGPQTRVTKSGGFSCQASPDGKYLYYLQSRERGQIWRIELSSGKEEPVLPEYKSRNWKVLSDGIYLVDTATNSGILQSRPGTAFFYRFATRKIEPLGFTTPRPITYTGIDLSPDRKWVYFPMTDAQATDLQLAENLPFR
jgi:WD40 repeat protein